MPTPLPYFNSIAQAEARLYYEAHPDSPAFLDCCGLVRAVFWELHRRREITFRLRRFNQNYQRRSLSDPSSRVSFAKAKPGDLVFYLARAVDGVIGMPSTQPCRHVEILVGDGSEASWGARWGGVVQLHGSYAFSSSRWNLIAHEFRSISAWLNDLEAV